MTQKIKKNNGLAIQTQVTGRDANTLTDGQKEGATAYTTNSMTQEIDRNNGIAVQTQIGKVGGNVYP